MLIPGVSPDDLRIFTFSISSISAIILIFFLLKTYRELRGGNAGTPIPWFILAAIVFALHSTGYSVFLIFFPAFKETSEMVSNLGHMFALIFAAIAAWQALRYWKPKGTATAQVRT